MGKYFASEDAYREIHNELAKSNPEYHFNQDNASSWLGS